MNRVTRFLAAASLTALLTACGGEGAKDRENGPTDREQPALGASESDDDDDKNKKEQKESRSEEDDDSND